MSTFKVEVVPVELLPHPNADSLSIVKIFDGFTVCVRTEDWKGVTKAAYIPPDSIVPNTEMFAFLDGHNIIRAKTLRGVKSYGMLVPAPEGSQIGDNVAEQLGITHYEPDNIETADGYMFDDPPPMAGNKYDIESWMMFRGEFLEGEEVVITEKINGTNARYTYQNGKLYVGGRSRWFKEGSGPYWRVLQNTPWIKSFCQLNPNTILYGEIFGAVMKGFKYGIDSKTAPYSFRAFDVYSDGHFLDYDDALGGARSDFLVPVLYRGPYSDRVVEDLIAGPSTVEGATNRREGVVIKPVKERFSERLCGRLILKAVDYLDGKKRG